MKTLEEGAKMLLVAWVKNWTMRTLLNVLCDGADDLRSGVIDECANAFPFMPRHEHWYAAHRGYGIEVRQFIADTYPKLSDRLWDLKEYKDCLKYADYVSKLKAGNTEARSKYSKKELNESASQRKQYRAQFLDYHTSRDIFKKHQRSSWTTVKA